MDLLLVRYTTFVWAPYNLSLISSGDMGLFSKKDYMVPTQTWYIEQVAGPSGMVDGTHGERPWERSHSKIRFLSVLDWTFTDFFFSSRTSYEMAKAYFTPEEIKERLYGAHTNVVYRTSSRSIGNGGWDPWRG
jgi:hypothetical protein